MTHQYQLGDYVRIHDHDGAEITVKITDSGIPNRQGDFAFKAGARVFKNSEILGLGEVPVTLAKDLEEQWALITPAPDTEVHADLVAENDAVNHPAHYTSDPSGVECIQITRHRNFAIGSAIKYLWRAGRKSEEGKTSIDKQIEDLNKSIWYIQDEINRLKSF